MARDLKRNLQSTSRSVKQWSDRWHARLRRIDLILTASALCWLLVRSLAFLLRRVRW